MALDALREAVNDVDEAQAVLHDKRAVRDDLIRIAVEGGMIQTRLAKVTGLSREQINRIAGKPATRDLRAV